MARFSRWIKREKIDAVSDTELKKILIKRGLIDSELTKSLRCYFCDDEISFNDISAILVKGGNLCIICNKSECLKKLPEDI